MIYPEKGAFEEYRFFPRNSDLVLVTSTADIRDFIVFTTKVALPTTLTEIGLSLEVAALKSIERLSRRVRQEAGLPEPVKYEGHH